MSNKIKKILAPLDGSENSFRALRYAIILAKECQATVTGVYVTALTQPQKDKQIEYVKKFMLKKALEFLTRAKKNATQKDILFYEQILYGNSGKQIILFSKKNKFDLIVMGSRGMGSAKELFFGSTSNYVLHKSQIPVLIVK